MGILLGIFIALSGIAAVLTLRSLTTFFHELGHAIPALLFTNEKVVVYVGSYGNTNGSVHLNIGRLEVFFKFNFLAWSLGMCSHSRVSKLWQELIIVIGGPVVSLLIGVWMILVMLDGESSEMMLFFAAVLLLASLIDFTVNILPAPIPLTLEDGGQTYNDGRQLLDIISRFRLPAGYFQLESLFHQEKYSQVLDEGYKLLNQYQRPPREIFRLMYETYLKSDQEELAVSMLKLSGKYHKVKDEDNLLFAQHYYDMKQFKAAIHFLNQYLYIHFTDARALLLRAQSYLALHHDDLAFKDLEVAIRLSDKSALSLALYGNLLRKAGREEEVLPFLEQSIKEDPELPEPYLFLAMYYEGKRDYATALDYYLAAQAKDTDFHGIDFKIEMLKNEVR